MIATGNCSWALPPTAAEEERLLAELDSEANRPSQPSGQRTGIVVIRSQSREMAVWLSAVCRNRGYATIVQTEKSPAKIEGATAAIFDAADSSVGEFAELARMSAALKPARVIALLSFPRLEDQRLALRDGAAAIVSKPVAINDLIEELENAENERGKRTRKTGQVRY